MAYEVVMSYHLHMPSYFLGTFTEYPYDKDMSKSVYEMNAENMPVAYKSNSIYHTVNLLTMTE